MWLNFLLVASGIFASFYWTWADGDLPESPVVTTEKEGIVTTGEPKSASFNMASLTKECCTKPAIHSDYQPIGIDIKIGNLDAYQTGDTSSKRVLIAVYDIFGYHPNTKQFVDQLAKYGFLVVMPDFFKGAPWDEKDFPIKDRAVLLEWIGKVGSWDKVVEPDLQSVVGHYKANGATAFGIFGFCWGGKMSVLAAASDLASSEIRGAALIHGSFIEESDADSVKVPILFLPSKNEADQEPLANKIKARLGDAFAEHFRFGDMEHGFAAARGDFKDTLTRTRVEEVIGHVSRFFNKHIPA